MNKPLGLHNNDTIEDAFKRADELSGVDFFSGMLCSRKDLRRIVLLTYEYKKLKEIVEKFIESVENFVGNERVEFIEGYGEIKEALDE